MNRGEIYFTELPRPAGRAGTEQFGTRPAVIIQATPANHSTIVIVPMTSNLSADRYSHCFVVSRSTENGLTKDSVALVHQIRAIDKSRLKNKAGELSKEDLQKLETEISLLLNLS